MFNRDDMRQKSMSPHNIYETMSRSRKRMPGSTWCCCKSQKKGKQASSRKFRRKAHVLLHQGKHHLLPFKPFEPVLASVHGTYDYCLENRAAIERLASLDCQPRDKTRGSLQLGFGRISYCSLFAKFRFICLLSLSFLSAWLERHQQSYSALHPLSRRHQRLLRLHRR